MEDREIIALYWQRDQTAIQETQRSYGRYLMKIASGILSNREDGEEVINDTCLKAWNSIPPNRPDSLSAYLGKIARRLAIDVLRTRRREKRMASAYAVSLSELEECVPGGVGAEEHLNLSLLAQAINAYLRTLAPQARSVFVERYFYMDSLKEIAACRGISESKVKNMLLIARLLVCWYDYTSSAIAKAAAVSESECLRCFRSIIGQPPIQYVTRYRVQKAAELLLAAPELGVAETGARFGVQHASYLAKTFHALKGCTPSEYRKQGRLNRTQGQI